MRKYILFFILFFSGISLFGQRVKDLAYFKGNNAEQLIGYGLVVGLAGSGDSYRSSFTTQSITSMLKQFGITVPETNLRTRNAAAVMITSTLSNNVKNGSKFDVNVSAMGDATSLMGGTLLMTPMLGIDRQVYGFAQGPVSVGGYDINTSSGGRAARNHSLTGRIPNGGLLKFDLPGSPLSNSQVTLILREPDYTTSFNMANAINEKLGNQSAASVDASEITVAVPADRQNNLVSFISELESIEVQKDVVARVVLNERTGTVVAGSNIRISPVTITHGSMNISIKPYPIISQPTPFSEGETVVFNNLIPNVQQEENNVYAIEGATNVQEVAAALNSLKVTPRDIISIFQALKEAGALTAELVII